MALRERVEPGIRRLLDMRTWNRYVRAEQVEQKSIAKAVKLWKNLKAS